MPAACALVATAVAILLQYWSVHLLLILAGCAWLHRYITRTRNENTSRKREHDRERIRNDYAQVQVDRERWQLEREQQAARHDDTTPYVPVTRRQRRAQHG